jgi:hypothetical protein
VSRALIVYYSRTEHTARLAETLAAELRRCGHEVVIEAIRVKRNWNKWLLPLPLLPLLPFLPLYLISARFRCVWHRFYFQPEQAIRPLAFADVSAFDLLLLGTPKWLYLSFPVARWLKEVRGLQGRRVAPFATFCGPPLKVFELEMLFDPLESRLRARGAAVTPAAVEAALRVAPTRARSRDGRSPGGVERLSPVFLFRGNGAAVPLYQSQRVQPRNRSWTRPMVRLIADLPRSNDAAGRGLQGGATKAGA